MPLIAHYKMNGDVADASGNGRHGTPTNVSFVAGKIGQAASFNGTTSKIDVANPGDVFDGKLLTVCSWLSRNGASGTVGPRVVDRVFNGQFAVQVRDDTNRMALAAKCVGGTFDITYLDGTVPPDGTATHATWVYTGTQILTYINGSLVGTQSANYGVLIASTSAMRIGDRVDGTNRKWKGWMGDLRIYNEALPAWKIQAIANDRRGRYAPWEPKIVRPLIGSIA
jgi:hypothetical protein